MKLNNKGMTIVEILISIALISIVIGFLFKILVDLNGEQESNDYAFNNQLNRAEFIHLIQNDLKSYLLTGIEDVSSETEDNITLNFYFKAGEKNAIAVLATNYKSVGENTRYYISYKDFNGNLSTYEVKGGRLANCGTFKMNKDDSQVNYYFKINIPVYSYNYHIHNNENDNNALDDFEITYFGSKTNLVSNDKYLTNRVSYNIGKVCN